MLERPKNDTKGYDVLFVDAASQVYFANPTCSVHSVTTRSWMELLLHTDAFTTYPICSLHHSASRSQFMFCQWMLLLRRCVTVPHAQYTTGNPNCQILVRPFEKRGRGTARGRGGGLTIALYTVQAVSVSLTLDIA